MAIHYQIERTKFAWAITLMLWTSPIWVQAQDSTQSANPPVLQSQVERETVLQSQVEHENSKRIDVNSIAPQIRAPTSQERGLLGRWTAEVFVLKKAGRSNEAEVLLNQILALKLTTYGETHPETADTLNQIAMFLYDGGRYAEAESFSRRTLVSSENIFRADHPKNFVIYNNLSLILYKQNRYTEAELLLHRALALFERIRGPNHPDTATSLNNLAMLYEDQGRYNNAEPLYRRALTISESAFGLNHRDTATSLNNLARLYQAQSRYGEAEPLYRRALTISESAFGLNHRDTATSLNNLARLYQAQSRYGEAEPLYRRALTISEMVLGLEHPDTATSLNNLAKLYQDQGRYVDAEPLYRRALTISEKALGPEHFATAINLNNLADVYDKQGRSDEAEQHHRLALAIFERALDPDHPRTLVGLEDVSLFFLQKRRFGAALDHSRRALARRRAFALREAGFGQENVQERLGDRAGVAASLVVRAAFEALRADGGSKPQDWLKALQAEAFEAMQQIRQSEVTGALARGAAHIAANVQGLGPLVVDLEKNFAQRGALDKQLIRAAIASGPDALALRDSLAQSRMRLDQTITQAEDQIGALYPAFFNLVNPDPVPLAAFHEQKTTLLRDDEALILITPGLITPDDPKDVSLSSGFVFATTKEGMAWAEIPFFQTELDAKIIRLSAILNHAATVRSPQTGAPQMGGVGYDRTTAKQLYDALFGSPQIAALIKDKPKWILAPQGALIGLPFAALITQTPEPGGDADPALLRRAAWLGLEKSISLIPSVSSLRTLRVLTRPALAGERNPFFGLGDPVFKGATNSWGNQVANAEASLLLMSDVLSDPHPVYGLPRLPGSRREIIEIADSYGVGSEAYLLGEAAREKTLREPAIMKRLERAKIVVFATHHFTAEELRSTLAEPALAVTPPPRGSVVDRNDDGLVAATEIAQFFLSADLVILSACNTMAGGKPNAESLTGLARSFFYAGARALLVSYWPVGDDEAVRLTTRTVALTPSIGRLQALREAMRELMQSQSQDAFGSSFAHPAAWAPFVLVGVD